MRLLKKEIYYPPGTNSGLAIPVKKGVCVGGGGQM